MKKRNKFLIITLSIFIFIALLCLGLALGFENIAKFFINPNNYWIYLVAGLYLLGVLFIVSWDWIKKL